EAMNRSEKCSKYGNILCEFMIGEKSPTLQTVVAYWQTRIAAYNKNIDIEEKKGSVLPKQFIQKEVSISTIKKIGLFTVVPKDRKLPASLDSSPQAEQVSISSNVSLQAEKMPISSGSSL